MDQNILYTIIAGLVALVLFLFARTNKSSSSDNAVMLIKQQEERLERTRREMNQLLNRQNELLMDQMEKSNKSISQQFAISQDTISKTQKETSEIIKNVTEKLAIVEKTNNQVVDFAKQMDSLEKILKNPKQRGVLGEYFLETTLKNVLPIDSFQMQYKFLDGEIVDAAVFIKDKIVPIDSKFSLENYNRLIATDDSIEKKELETSLINDLKKRIEETSKYIRPNENTMDFAFMFIPSEGIYYDLLINKIGGSTASSRDLLTYAFSEKKVIIVSPTSFLAYLQTVLQGLRALKIEESALEIKENVMKLVKHLKAYEENYDKVGKNLNTTINFYNKSVGEFKKIDKDVLKITGESIELTSSEIETSEIIN